MSFSGGIFATGTGDFFLGAENTGAVVLWDGLLRRFRFWKGRTLTSNERTTLYNGGNGIDYATLVAGGAPANNARILIAPVGFS